MDLTTVLQLILTLLTVTVFNLRTLRTITNLHKLYDDLYRDVMIRLSDVERLIADLQREEELNKRISEEMDSDCFS